MALLRLSFTLLLFSLLPAAFAQQVERKLFITLPDSASADLVHAVISFDSAGNFCFYNRPPAGPVITNTGTYGPFREQTSYYPVTFYNTKEKGQYIKGERSPVMHGPIDGTLATVPIINTRDYFAFTVSKNDSVSYFVNDNHIATTDSVPATRLWCTFSTNGNVLYTISKGEWNYLYLNYKLIDSSRYVYGALAVDNENNYRYSLGSLSYSLNKGICGNYTSSTYTPIPHAPLKVYGPVAAHGSVFMPYYDTLYYYGNGSGAAYLLENDSLFRYRVREQKIVAPGGGQNFLTYTPSTNWMNFTIVSPQTETRLNVNGKAVRLPYSDVYFPCMDAQGNYSLFGLRDYYLYKNINGTEQRQPLSKYGVRATPLSIDAQGNTICYYTTDDSVYVYENDRLFNKCGVTQFNMQYASSIFMLTARIEQDAISGFCMDTSCYIVYKNVISPPILKITMHSGWDTFKTGNVIYSDLNDHGYWLLQKAGFRQYNLVVNGRRITLPGDVYFESPLWFWLARNFSLTDKEFIFYTEENLHIYRYKISL